MKTSPHFKKSVALSLTLHAAVFGAVLGLDEHDQAQNTELEQQQLHAIKGARLNTITAPPTVPESRTAIMNMYNAQVLIPLVGEINEESAGRVLAQYQMAAHGYANDYFITLATNSGGGEVHWGNVIANEINNSPVPTRILCTQQASSMAAMILITTTNVFSRDATNECALMIHAPYHSYEAGEQAIAMTTNDYAAVEEMFHSYPELPEWTLWLDKQNEGESIIFSREDIAIKRAQLETMAAKFAHAISENSHLSEQDVSALFARGDIHLSALEAQFMGLIDHIEGAEMDGINTIAAQSAVCNRFPEISLCKENAAPDLRF